MIQAVVADVSGRHAEAALSFKTASASWLQLFDLYQPGLPSQSHVVFQWSRPTITCSWLRSAARGVLWLTPRESLGLDLV